MTEMQFRSILCDAMNQEYRWVPEPEELEYDYTFSPEFEKKMRKMIRRSEGVRIGSHVFRKMTVVILAAVMMLALAACAVYLGVTWQERENARTGTLDITFDTEKSSSANEAFEKKEPALPENFALTSTNSYPSRFEAVYENHAGQGIDYVQDKNLETMGLSIDSDDESFTRIEVNGHKGYAVIEGTAPYLIWSDGEYLYYLSGNVSYDVLEKMADSIE